MGELPLQETQEALGEVSPELLSVLIPDGLDHQPCQAGMHYLFPGIIPFPPGFSRVDREQLLSLDQ